MSAGGKKSTTTSPNAASLVHKVEYKSQILKPVAIQVIMVGSGGVGKSALTLQFMYDEVILLCFLRYFLLALSKSMKKTKTRFKLSFYSLSKSMNRPKLIPIERRWCLMERNARLIFSIQRVKKIIQQSGQESISIEVLQIGDEGV